LAKVGLPSDALQATLPTALLVVAAAARAAGRLPSFPAAVMVGLAMLFLLLNLRRRGLLEREAFGLCDQPLSDNITLAHSLKTLKAKLDGVRGRLDQRHPVTEWRTREHLQDVIVTDIETESGPRLLGLIRFKDFDRLAAFDHSAANTALKAFADRLSLTVNSSHAFGQIDRDCFGLWFRGQDDLESAAAAFLSIVYVAAQELPYGDQLLKPTLDAAWVSAPRDGLEHSPT
jgi:GGDEF domain-containing protein